jgi:hypothetical protein
MPKSKGSTYKFFDRSGKDYPFYAPDEFTAIRYALVWSRARGIKLYRRRRDAS